MIYIDKSIHPIYLPTAGGTGMYPILLITGLGGTGTYVVYIHAILADLRELVRLWNL